MEASENVAAVYSFLGFSSLIASARVCFWDPRDVQPKEAGEWTHKGDMSTC